MEDYDVRSAASILASVKEQEARFEQLTRALEEERRNVTLQLERANMPPNAPNSQPLAWQQVVMQVNHVGMFGYLRCPVSLRLSDRTDILLPSSIGVSSFHPVRSSLLSLMGLISVILQSFLCHSVPWWLQRQDWWDQTFFPIIPRLHCLPLNPICFHPRVFDGIHGSSDWMWPLAHLWSAMGRAKSLCWCDFWCSWLCWILNDTALIQTFIISGIVKQGSLCVW